MYIYLRNQINETVVELEVIEKENFIDLKSIVSLVQYS